MLSFPTVPRLSIWRINQLFRSLNALGSILCTMYSKKQLELKICYLWCHVRNGIFQITAAHFQQYNICWICVFYKFMCVCMPADVKLREFVDYFGVLDPKIVFAPKKLLKWLFSSKVENVKILGKLLRKKGGQHIFYENRVNFPCNTHNMKKIWISWKSNHYGRDKYNFSATHP